MSEFKRIISKVEIKNNFVVKGYQLEGLKKISKPEETIKKYFIDGIDEIFIQDVVASLYGQTFDVNYIQKILSGIFVPVTISGGIRNMSNARDIMRKGSDRISLNSAILKNEIFLKELITHFGSSNIIASVEAKKFDNKYYCMSEYGRNNSEILLEDHLKRIQNIGVGEVILISVDNDGSDVGINDEILEIAKKNLKIPIVYQGGISSIEHIVNAFKKYDIDGVCLCSILLKNYFIQKNDLNNQFFTKDKNLNLNILKIKKILSGKGIKVRI
jgi:imidazole glycerol-phosphate synthase subunit HisF